MSAAAATSALLASAFSDKRDISKVINNFDFSKVSFNAKFLPDKYRTETISR